MAYTYFDFYRHTQEFENPHQVTQAQVGLDQVCNYPKASIDQAKQLDLFMVYLTPLTVNISLTQTFKAIQLINDQGIPIPKIPHEAKFTGLDQLDHTVDPVYYHHLQDHQNPHEVNKTQVGLGAIDNQPMLRYAQWVERPDQSGYLTPRTLKAIIDNTLVDLNLIDAQGQLNVKTLGDALFEVADDGTQYDFISAYDLEDCGGALIEVGADGTYYVACESGWLYAIGHGGRLRWRYYCGGCTYHTLYVGPNGYLYTTSSDGMIRCWAPNGRLVWSDECDACSFTSLGYGGGSLYGVSQTGGVWRWGLDGQRHWSMTPSSGSALSVTVTSSGHALVGCEGQKLCYIHPNGSVIWSRTYPQGPFTQLGAGAGGLYFALCHQGYLHCLDETGRLIWSNYRLNCSSARFQIRPQGGVYLLCGDGRIVCINEQGLILWQSPGDSQCAQDFSITPYGYIYTTCDEGQVKLTRIDNPKHGYQAEPLTYDSAWTQQVMGDAIHAIACDYQECLYVGLKASGLYKLNADGNVLYHLEQDLAQVNKIAIDSEDQVVVAQGQRVKKYNSQGHSLWVFSGHGDTVHGLTVDREDAIYSVGGANDRTLRKISPEGQELWRFTHPSGALNAVTTGQDGFIYTVSDNAVLYKHTFEGELAWMYQSGSHPYLDVAVDYEGFVYIGTQNHWVICVDPLGQEHSRSTQALAGAVNALLMGHQRDFYTGTGGSDSKVQRYNPELQVQWSDNEHTQPIQALGIGCQGYVYSGGDQQILRRHQMTHESCVNRTLPYFKIMNITLNQTQLLLGETLTATIKIRNTGEVGTVQTVSVKRATQILFKESVYIASQSDHTFHIEYQANSVGNYHLVISTDQETQNSATFTIKEPAYFAVQSLTLTPETIILQQKATIDAVLRNTGGVSDTQTIRLNINDSSVDQRQVTLASGQSTTTTFDYTPMHLGSGTDTIRVFSEDSQQTQTLTLVEPQPTYFKINSVTLNQTTLNQGSLLRAQISLTNTGEVSGSRTIRFYFSGQVVASQSLTLAYGQTQTLTLEHTVNASGSHQAYVDSGFESSNPQSVIVNAPAYFHIDNLTITPNPLEEGKNLTIRVFLRNTGDLTATKTVHLVVNGQARTQRNVGLAAGATKTETFYYQGNQLGSHTLHAKTPDHTSATESFTVYRNDPAFFIINSVSLNKTTLDVGENLTVTANIQNTGDVSGTQSIRLLVNNVIQNSVSRSLSAGSSQNVQLSYSLPSAGSMGVRVQTDDALSSSQNITVVQPGPVNHWESGTFVRSQGRFIRSMVVDSQRNLYVTSADDQTNEGFLEKLDPLGNVLWSVKRSYLSTGALAIDGSHQIYMAGCGFAFADKMISKYSSDGTLLGVFASHTNPINDIAVNSDGTLIYTGTFNGVHRISASGDEVWHRSLNTSAHGVAVDPRNGNVVAGTSGHTVRRYSSSNGSVWNNESHTARVSAVTVDASGFTYSVSSDNTVRKIHPNGSLVWTHTGHLNWVQCVAVRANGEVFSGSQDNTVRGIRANGTEFWYYSTHGRNITALAVDHLGYVYSGDALGRIARNNPT